MQDMLEHARDQLEKASEYQKRYYDRHHRHQDRDVQWEVPIPSLPYGFKPFPPGNFPYGKSPEIPKIREFPKLREFPILWESWEFPSHGKFSFSKCKHIRFSISFFALESLFYVIFNYVCSLFSFTMFIEISFLEEGGIPK